ncbi:MAG: OmpA family protein, partial [Gammaproteobacteria bacterium]
SGCSSTPVTTVEPFQPIDLNELLSSGQYRQKAEYFFVINDHSSSMREKYDGQGLGFGEGAAKLSVAIEMLSRINQTIPDLKMTAGLRSFGSGPCTGSNNTFLNMPLAAYSKSTFQSGIESLTCASGISPMQQAVDAAGSDLGDSSGRIALLIQSDGHELQTNPDPAIAILKTRYGDRLCVYTIWFGNEDEADGKQVLKSLSDSAGCGFLADGANLATPSGTAEFVKAVFLEPVSAAGCESLDSDHDGVNDCDDHCPDTLKGAHVNRFGCWIVDIKFDNDKSDIKPQYYGELDSAAQVIMNNPGVTIEVQGHTSSTGTAVYNQKLSERRANAVTQYLNQAIGGSATLVPRGYGLTQPTDTNDTEEGRANNRRVELQVIR